jgi:copper resistance protein B
MKRLLALLVAGATSPAVAQHTGQTASAPAAPTATTCTPEHAALGHCTLPPAPKPTQPADPHAGHTMPATAAQPQAVQRPKPNCTPQHAAMGHCTMPSPMPPQATQPAPQPQTAVCSPEHAAMGHCSPAPAAQEAASTGDPHAGHTIPGQSTASQPEMSRAPPPAAALQGPENAADSFWGQQAMARSRKELREEHGDIPAYKVLIDQLETRIRKGRDGYFLNAEAWYGGDINKVWLKTEVEGDFRDKAEQAEFQALWSRAINPWFDLQTGIRYDARPDKGTSHLVLGLQGLAPHWIEVDAAAFLSAKGNVTARFEAEHDARITQKLILQPRAELDFSFQDVPSEGLGSGLAVAELGLRLRYHISQQFSPYVGLEYDRAFGRTRKFRRRDGEDAGGLSFVTGLRFWF